MSRKYKTDEERQEALRQYRHKYYQKKREDKEWMEKKREYDKKYNEENKEKRNKKAREYEEKKKEQLEQSDIIIRDENRGYAIYKVEELEKEKEGKAYHEIIHMSRNIIWIS